MPTATNGPVSLHYETSGTGETIVFVGDVGYGAWQWGWQHAALAGPFETLVTDLRGTGRSDSPPGPYSVDLLAADVQAVLEAHGARRAHVVGAGLGGMVALELARISSRPRTLTLLGTAASGAGLTLDPLFGDPDDPDALEASLEAAFTREFVESHPDVVDRIVEWRAGEDAGREAWEAQAAAVAAFDASDRLYEVTTPALVCHGTADAVWPVERGRALAEDLPRGTFVAVEDVGHLVHVEGSGVVNDHLWGILEDGES
ncbi:alpha/beta fold hydrolase [Haloplanus sp. GCM10025708]|uniref:alpha/beta fold hydrolase n=1 Tax=Haloferacaceae TaxID=1644056 RepID=UPI00361C33C4